MLTYLIIASIVFVLTIAVQAHKEGPNFNVVDLLACLLCALVWPLFLLAFIGLTIAERWKRW